MNMVPLLVSWAVLASVVLGLAVYRKVVARQEDDYIHFDAKTSENQIMMAKKLEGIDKWGKLLTIVVAVYSLVVLAVFLYNGWTNKPPIE